MGFFSDIGGALSGFPGLDSVGGALLGGDAADAARDGARIQAQAADRAIDLQRESRDLAREDLAPFREFGANNLAALSDILTPEGQASFLQNNPLADLALDNANQTTLKSSAARGKLGSGSTLQSLTDNFLLTSLPLLQNQQNQLFNSVNLGQASASGQANTTLQTGNSLSNLITGQGAVQAGGIIGAANARQQGINNLIGLGGQLGGAAIAASDRRLKENIEKVGSDEFGNIYEFNYIGNPQRYRGRIAQELKEIKPDAVSVGENGYLQVSEQFSARPI